MNNDKVIPYANDADDGPTCFEFRFGAYGSTVVRVWARHLESALDLAVDWLEDNAPGHLVELDELDYVTAAVEQGLDVSSEDEDIQNAIREHAEVDLTPLDSGKFLRSWEWTADEVEP